MTSYADGNLRIQPHVERTHIVGPPRPVQPFFHIEVPIRIGMVVSGAAHSRFPECRAKTIQCTCRDDSTAINIGTPRLGVTQESRPSSGRLFRLMRNLATDKLKVEGGVSPKEAAIDLVL
jgi:hypothetical protein